MNNSCHDQSTLRLGTSSSKDRFPEAVGLTILFHPQTERIGEIAPLLDYIAGPSAQFSRIEPIFRNPDGRQTEALASPVLSRKPIIIEVLPDGKICLENTSHKTKLIAEGEPLQNSRIFSHHEFRRGIVLIVADSLVLLLHPMHPFQMGQDSLGLIGCSASIQTLRSAILNVADLDVPVLLQGESGVGKELVATAIHRHSPRANKPYICVNISAIPETLAAAELFGYTKGAFTGALQNSSGYFSDADGGTLFLDEIGDTALEVQPMLLRAIENKKLQPLGGKIRDIDVRLITATDSDLEHAVKKGLFRQPLLQRLSGYHIKVPPLRERREDIGRLFIYFLTNELKSVDQVDRLKEISPGKSWVPAGLVAELARFDWPGNVRQLQNVTRQLVISNRESSKLCMDVILSNLFSRSKCQTKSSEDLEQPLSSKRRIADLTDQEIIDTLKKHKFNLNATCAELDVSRTWLNTYIDRSPHIRKAKDLSAEEIKQCAIECEHDLHAMASRLGVSCRGLLLQKKRLGL